MTSAELKSSVQAFADDVVADADKWAEVLEARPIFMDFKRQDGRMLRIAISLLPGPDVVVFGFADFKINAPHTVAAEINASPVPPPAPAVPPPSEAGSPAPAAE